MIWTTEELAKRFCVDDLAAAMPPGTRLHGILVSCAEGKMLAAHNEAFLRSRGLLALAAFAKGEIVEAGFQPAALAEQRRRKVEREADAQAEVRRREALAAAAEARQVAMWAEIEAQRARRENDPRHVARRQNRALRERYGIHDFVEEGHYSRLMRVLRNLSQARRLDADDVLWLAGEGRDFRTAEIMCAHHRLEADHFLAEYRQDGDVWCAVNASGHLRKCNAADEAHALLSAIKGNSRQSRKTKAAVCTTHGGVMRDLGHHEDAIRLAEQAHALLDSDYRPCTLLGAVHIETGDMAAGHAWYRKAEERGAPPEHVDSELRAILVRLSPDKRKEAVSQLLEADPRRYGWLKTAFAKAKPDDDRDRDDRVHRARGRTIAE